MAKAVKLIELPGLKEKEDVTDWCRKGQTKEQLLRICHGIPALKSEDLPSLEAELQRIKDQARGRGEKKKTGEEILADGDPLPKFHPAMDFFDGVLMFGFRYGDNPLWITSKREILSEDQFKETYGYIRTSPAGDGPSKEACFRWRDGHTIDGTDLYQRILAFLRRYVVFQHDWQPAVIALYVLNTYLYRIHPVCPVIHVTAPEKSSGKTRLLEVMAAICFGKPQIQVDPSEAVLFREPELTALSLFWDEAETLDRAAKSERDERISVLNAGYRNGGVVKRFDKNAGKIISYETYRPMILSGISRLPEATASRSLTVDLQRRKPSERIENLNLSRIQQFAAQLRDDCYLWALANASDLADAYRVAHALPIPNRLPDRLREIIEPLFAIATVIDGANITGPAITTLKQASEHLACGVGDRETEESARIQALQILYENFPHDEDRWPLTTEDCLKLCQKNGMDWIERPRQVQRLLNSWGWKSTASHVQGNRVRAYYIHRHTLMDKVERYTPHLLPEPAPQPDDDPHPEN